MDISDIFYFLSSGKGEAGVPGAGRGGVAFLSRIRRGGGRGAGVCGELGNWGGGANYFFSGPKCPWRLHDLRFRIIDVTGHEWYHCKAQHSCREAFKRQEKTCGAGFLNSSDQIISEELKEPQALVHRIAAFAMAIPRCQWRHRCVVTLGKFLVVLYSKPLWRKAKWKQRRKGDVRDVKKISRAMLKNREGHHSDDTIK